MRSSVTHGLEHPLQERLPRAPRFSQMTRDQRERVSVYIQLLRIIRDPSPTHRAFEILTARPRFAVCTTAVKADFPDDHADVRTTMDILLLFHQLNNHSQLAMSLNKRFLPRHIYR
jgi:hypothetical protein